MPAERAGFRVQGLRLAGIRVNLFFQLPVAISSSVTTPVVALLLPLLLLLASLPLHMNSPPTSNNFMSKIRSVVILLIFLVWHLFAAETFII